MEYKKFGDLKLSEIGIGTYLGNPDEETDKNYYETIKLAVDKGINVVDTAINYRNMRSEVVIGKVAREVGRDRMIISTKGGYLTGDFRSEKKPVEWIKENLIDKGIINISEVTEYGNVLTPSYIDWSFNKSLENLDTEYIDVYFLHNPEEQLTKFSREEFLDKIRAVFRLLEGKVQEGKLKYYGLATWSGFRVPKGYKQLLNLKEIYDIARDVGGNEHHFRFIQLPYNLAMLEAFTLKNQIIDGEELTPLEAAERLGIYTYISSPLFQGRVIGTVNPDVKTKFKVFKDVHLPIQFVRSTPGVGTVLIGMSKKEHLLENIEIEDLPKLTSAEIKAILNIKG